MNKDSISKTSTDGERIMTTEGHIHIFKQVVDYLSPLQTPTEQSVYNYLLRWSLFEDQDTVQIGDRSLATAVSASAKGKLSKSNGLSPSTIRTTLQDLKRKGHIQILSVDRKGKMIKINLPQDIEECQARMRQSHDSEQERDYFNDSDGRKEMFERDNWTCAYCGEKVDTGVVFYNWR